MPCRDALLDAARADDHVAFELITGWSYSAGKQLGGNPVPGMWMTGNALRLMERTRPGVLHADLLACHAYADGLAARGGGALSGAADRRGARPHGAAEERAGAARRAAGQRAS